MRKRCDKINNCFNKNAFVDININKGENKMKYTSGIARQLALKQINKLNWQV